MPIATVVIVFGSWIVLLALTVVFRRRGADDSQEGPS